MALKFFWRCEGETLDGTHDYSAGDTSATATGTASISATAVRVGTNGVLFDGGAGAYYGFDPASIFSTAEGSAAFLFKLTRSNGGYPFLVRGTSANDKIGVNFLGSSGTTTGNIRLSIRKSTGSEVNVDTNSGNLAQNVWYGCVIRWKSATTAMAIEIYTVGDSGTTITLVDSATGTYGSDNIPVDLTSFRVGECDGGANMDGYIDNVFVSNTYAEALETKLLITSYTEYAGGSILPHAMANYRMRRA